MKTYEVGLHTGAEVVVFAKSFMTTEENHLLFIDDEAEVCSRFKEWLYVVEMRKR